MKFFTLGSLAVLMHRLIVLYALSDLIHDLKSMLGTLAVLDSQNKMGGGVVCRHDGKTEVARKGSLNWHFFQWKY